MTPPREYTPEELKPRIPVRSARVELVDALERAYGPVLLSVGFTLFLALADPAHEVMMIYGSEVYGFFNSIRRGWIPLGYAVFIAAVFATIPYSRILNFFTKSPRSQTAIEVFVGFFVSSLFLAFASIGPNLATLLTAYDNKLTPEESQIVNTWMDYGFKTSDEFTRVVLGFVVFFFVPVALYYATRVALWAQYADKTPKYMNSKNFTPHRADHLLLVWTGRLPLLGAAVGFCKIIAGTEATVPEKWVMAVLAFLCLAAALGKFFLWWFNDRDTSPNDRFVQRCLGWLPVGIGVVIGFVVISSLFPATAEAAGPIAITSSFVIVMGTFLASLTLLSSRFVPGQFPLVLLMIAVILAVSGSKTAYTVAGIFALLALGSLFFEVGKIRVNWLTVFAGCIAIAFVALGWLQQKSTLCTEFSGCHLMQGVEPGEAWRDNGLADLGQAFDAWTDDPKRAGVDEIILIAAQGGGLFAGYHAAYDLAARQDASRTQPTSFADKVFAISGVSGGSVGAATFWAVRESGLCELERNRDNETCYRDAVHAVLSSDFLSAALSKLLFADNLESLVPYSAWNALPSDRGHALFERFNAAVNRMLLQNNYLNEHTTDLVKRGLRNSWSKDGTTPLLFLNTTDLFTGERVIQSPVSCFLPGCDTFDHKAELRLPAARVTLADSDNQPRDLTVGEAAILSARFPVVTPPGRYLECGDPDCTPEHIVQKQIADGGYFDNTGLETMADILSGLEAANRTIPVTVYSYSIREKPAERSMKGVLGAPINGVVAATTARRGLTVDRFCNRWVTPKGQNDNDEDTAPTAKLRVKAINALLDLRTNATHNFTLSWLIAPSSLESIQTRVATDPGSDDVPLCE